MIRYDSWYCWWTKSCTTKDDDYHIIYRLLTIPGGAGFCPPTVFCALSQFFVRGSSASATEALHAATPGETSISACLRCRYCGAAQDHCDARPRNAWSCLVPVDEDDWRWKWVKYGQYGCRWMNYGVQVLQEINERAEGLQDAAAPQGILYWLVARQVISGVANLCN